jgi:hypothetical protein
MTVAGVGSFELLSFTLREPASVAVVFDAGRDGARFMRAAAEGRSFESVTIPVGARTITLEDVVVTSIHVPERHGDDGFVLSLELSGSSRVFT